MSNKCPRFSHDKIVKRKNFHNKNSPEKESRKFKKYIKFKMVYAIIFEKKNFLSQKSK